MFVLVIIDENPPKKKLKINAKNQERVEKWEKLGEKIKNLGVKLKAAEKSPVFAFVEGTLVKAIKNGKYKFFIIFLCYFSIRRLGAIG